MYHVGIDLGGTKIAAGLVDNNGKLLNKDSIPTYGDRGYQPIVKDMAMLVLKVIRDSGKNMDEVRNIGIGVPGCTNKRENILIYANNLSNCNNSPIGRELQKYVNLPVFMDNDANCAALAESVAGASKGAAHSILVTIGTGLGGGAVIDGRIYSGFNDAALELGHMAIELDGVECNCGGKGCWEKYASATALIRQTQEAIRQNPDSLINKLVGGDMGKVDAKTAFDAAKQGDDTGLKVVDAFINYLAVGITNVINIFQPEILVIGGGVSKEGEYLLKPLRERVLGQVYGAAYLPLTQIKVAQMGNDAGIIGAALLGREF